MNTITVMGRVGKDPESRFTQNGKKVTSFSLATHLRRGGKEETLWFRVTVWGESFDKMLSFIKIGSALIVVGELSTSSFTNREGQTQTSLEVTAHSLHFSPFGKGIEGGEGEAAQRTPLETSSAGAFVPGKSTSQEDDPFEDESIPF